MYDTSVWPVKMLMTRSTMIKILYFWLLNESSRFNLKIFENSFVPYSNTIESMCSKFWPSLRVPLTISYHPRFLSISNVCSMLHHGSVLHVLHVQSKQSNSLFWYFFLYIFHQKNHSFFWWSIKFRQQVVKSLETRIGYKKLSVELRYGNI